MMLMMFFTFQLSVKSPQTPADGAEQGDVVCQEKLIHAVYDVQSVSLFLELMISPPLF